MPLPSGAKERYRLPLAGGIRETGITETRRQYMIVDWIPVDEDNPESFPKTDNYILISYNNYSLIDIGRYERDRDGGGAFYTGDDSKSCASYGLFVNAWMPMIQPYREEQNQ